MLITILLFSFVLAIANADICYYGGSRPQGYCAVELFYGTLNEAISTCRKLVNSTLAVIHSQNQQIGLSQTLQYAYPDGYLTDHPTTDTTIWLYFKNGTWLDGSNYWPNSSKERPDQLVLKRELNGTGTLMKPTQSAGVICIYQPLPSNVCKIPSFTTVSKWFFDIPKRKCQYANTVNINKTFSAANGKCQSLSMQLPTILNSRDNNLIYRNSSKWLSGEQMIYGNFCTDTSDPNCGQKAGDNMCLVMILNGKNAGTWSFLDCSKGKALTVCQSINPV